VRRSVAGERYSCELLLPVPLSHYYREAAEAAGAAGLVRWAGAG
jgi:hypothetical protein